MRRHPRRRTDAGFTLIEVLTASLMIVLLAGLAYPPLRSYWFRQSLDGAAASMISEMRGLQSRVTAESHPLVYGVRFTTANDWMATGKWGLVKFDPTGGPGGIPSCTQFATGTFGSGLFNATVEIVAPDFTPVPETTTCRALPGAGSDQFAFFYARGTATGGTLRLHQSSLGSAKDVTIQVFPLTGRVERQ